MSVDAAKNLLKKTMNVDESNLSSLVSQPSMLDSKSIGNIDALKGKLMGAFDNLGSMTDISPSKLQSLTKTLGIDVGDFKKIVGLASSLMGSGLLSGSPEQIKKKLLEQLTLKNLIDVANNDSVKKLLADYVKVDIDDLTALFKSSIQIKTISDIKNMEIYTKLDNAFKEKLASDNGITLKMLDTVIAASIKLYSKEEIERKQAEVIAKTLEEDFTKLLFETQTPNIPDDTASTGGTGGDMSFAEKRISTFDFSNNFTKVDYRVQKIAALSLGFGDGEKSVDELVSTIDKLKRLAILQKRERDLKKSLLNHLDNLQESAKNNNEMINDYSEECGVAPNEVKELIDSRNVLAVELETDETPIGKIESDLDADNTGDCVDGGGTFGDGQTLPSIDFNIQLYDFNDVIDPTLLKQDEDGDWIYDGDISFEGRELLLFNKISPHSQVIRFPIDIYKVNGSLKIGRQGLTTLENMPNIITGDFDCSNNPIQSLIGMPIEIGGSINVSSTKIKNLTNIPNDVKGNFNCSKNELENLAGSPTYVRGNFDCSSNLLDSLSGSPLQVFGDMICVKNELVDLKGAPDEVQGTFDCSNNELTQNPELLRTGNTMRVRGKFICENQNSGKKLDATYLKDTFGASSVIV